MSNKFNIFEPPYDNTYSKLMDVMAELNTSLECVEKDNVTNNEAKSYLRYAVEESMSVTALLNKLQEKVINETL